MKNYKLAFLLGAFALGTIFTACDKFDDDVPPARMEGLIVNDDFYTTVKNQGVQLNVLANDTINGTAVFNFTQPQQGTIQTDSVGNVYYQPALDFVGSDFFTYKACLGNNCATANVTITVLLDSSNTCQVKANDDFKTIYSSAYYKNIYVLMNDNLCGVDTFTTNLSITKGPAHGQAYVTSSYRIYYNPASNYSGQDEITYTISNIKGQSTAKLFINVPPQVCATTAWPDTASMIRHLGTAYDSVTVNVLRNDVICPNGGPVIVSVINSQTTYGNVQVIGNGANAKIIYGTTMPVKNVYDNFQYKICQGGNCSTNNVQIGIR